MGAFSGLVTPELAGAFMLAFARVGTIAMLTPGFGERAVPMRFRVGLAAILAVAAMPWTRPLAAGSTDALSLAPTLIGEIVVGLTIGLSVRAIASAAASAGALIATQAGLAYATTIDPGRGAAETTLSTLLSMTAVALIFAADLHLVAVGAILKSYATFPPLGAASQGDAARHLLDAVADGFSLAVTLAAPFLFGGLILNLGFGVLGKAMPQLQLFQLSFAASIVAAIVLLAVALDPMSRRWLDAYQAALAAFGGT